MCWLCAALYYDVAIILVFPCWIDSPFPLITLLACPHIASDFICFLEHLFQELHGTGQHKLSQAGIDIPIVVKWFNTQEKRLQIFTTAKGRFVFSRNVSFVLAGVSDTFCIMINPYTFFMQIVTQQLLLVASSCKRM